MPVTLNVAPELALCYSAILIERGFREELGLRPDSVGEFFYWEGKTFAFGDGGRSYVAQGHIDLSEFFEKVDPILWDVDFTPRRVEAWPRA